MKLCQCSIKWWNDHWDNGEFDWKDIQLWYWKHLKTTKSANIQTRSQRVYLNLVELIVRGKWTIIERTLPAVLCSPLRLIQTMQFSIRRTIPMRRTIGVFHIQMVYRPWNKLKVKTKDILDDYSMFSVIIL